MDSSGQPGMTDNLPVLFVDHTNGGPIPFTEPLNSAFVELTE